MAVTINTELKHLKEMKRNNHQRQPDDSDEMKLFP